MTTSKQQRGRVAAAQGALRGLGRYAAVAGTVVAASSLIAIASADDTVAPAALAASDAAPPAAGDAAAQVASRGHVESAQVQEVTVTARRREEKVQDVPIPITTLSGDALDKDGTFRLEDLSQKLPSSNFQFSNPRQTSLAVRGLGNNPANDALESSVGVYLDNVYLGRPGMANADLIDIDQVALLRGPQGTLFGKNTTAGVLNVSTRAPSFTPEAIGELSGGTLDFFQARGAVSGPIVGNALAVRISAVESDQGGSITDIDTGGKYNGFHRKGMRGQLLYQSSGDFSLRVIGDFNHEASSCCVASLYSFGPVVTLPNGGKGYAFPYFATQAGAITPSIDPEFRTTQINDKQYMQVNQGGASAEANWTLPSGYRLTSISAYRSWGFLPTNDADGLSVSAIPNAGQGVDDKQFSQELRLASPSGRSVEYVLGTYYFFQNQDNNQFTRYGPAAGAYLGAAALNNLYSQIRSNPTTDSSAAFAQATWHASDALSLTGGIRETYEAKSLRIIRDTPTRGGAPVTGPLPFYDSGAQALNNYDLSGLLSLDYKFSRDVLGYLSFAHGAKAGGINASVPGAGLGASSLYIAPEKANDAELGFKTTLWHRRLTFNANAYWTLVKNYQATQLVQTSPGVYVQNLSNIGYVRSQGLETEVQAVPVRWLTLSLTASYNDAIYRSYANAPCSAEAAAAGQNGCSLTAAYGVAGFQNLSGSQVVGAPRWIVNPGLTLKHRLFDDVRGYFIGDYAWRSSFFGAPDNSQYSRIAAYGIARFHAGLTKELGPTTLDVSLFADNAFDKHYVLGGLGLGSYLAYSEYAGPPRIVGITARLDY
ncbi:MAG: TonB-dependent receptor [Nevskia sp.]|nr:TonB-dependent receptor [Nevskia sp.]